MARDRNSNALQIIFSFFLGLMVLAFIGIGVNTFYPSPVDRNQDELQSLYRQQERLSGKVVPSSETSEADRAELDRVQKQIDAITKRQDAQMKVWARNTSIVLILFATIVMGISLVRSEQLRVISNGLLLGGLFTMVYGSGWVIFAGKSTARFVVILLAFMVTLALGYAKFVRGARVSDARSATGPAATSAGAAPELADLESRVALLEARAAAAATAWMSGEQTAPEPPAPPAPPSDGY